MKLSGRTPYLTKPRQREMKPQDLRIDNYINYKGHTVQLTSQDFMQLQEDINDGIIKPLKLTEQWLKDFGFYERVMMPTSKMYELEPLVIDSFTDGFEARFRYSEGESSSIKKVRYVHEVQNLYYALTNTELILKDGN